MSDTAEFQLPTLHSAADVESWHPDIANLIRENVPFICFDRETAPIHVSPPASAILLSRLPTHHMLDTLRAAAREAFEISEQPSQLPAPRVMHRVNDAADSTFWAFHVVTTRHDWPVAIAVREGDSMSPPEPRKRARLTQRELEVAAMVAKGAQSRGIADSLAISVHTARRHTENVYAKLGLHSRVQLTNWVYAAREMQYASEV